MSLSGNQIGLTFRVFVLHRELKDFWYYPLNTEIELDPKDYKAYINPKLDAVTDMNEFAFE